MSKGNSCATSIRLILFLFSLVVLAHLPLQESLATDASSVQQMVEEGKKYLDGKGVPKDYTKAFALFQKAADQGNANGQNNLGSMYYNGRGVPQDYKKAVEWYQKAADQGNTNAKAKVQEVTNILNPRAKIEVNPVKSIEDGFRGIPWGMHKKEAISLFGLYESELGEIMRVKAYARKDENLSFGNVNLLSLVYVFGEDFQATDDAKKGFLSALATFENVYFHPLIEEISKSFGQPTIFGGIKNEWHFKNAKIILEMKLDNRFANITIVRQFPEQQNQRGGGF